MLAVLALSVFGSYAQKSVFFNDSWKPVPDSSKATYKRTILPSADGLWRVTDYRLDGTKLLEGLTDSGASAAKSKSFRREGRFVKYHDNGAVSEIGKYRGDKKEGDYLRFYEDGTLSERQFYQSGKPILLLAYHANGRLSDSVVYVVPELPKGYEVYAYHVNGVLARHDLYEDLGVLRQGVCYDSTGVVREHTPYETMPQFPGGVQALLHYITSTLRYPAEAQKKCVQGRVYVSFVVTEDGDVDNVKVARGVHPLLDREAMRVVKVMPKWQPGEQRGKKVKVNYTLPINFVLG